MTTTLQDTIMELVKAWAVPRRPSDSDLGAPDLELACSCEEARNMEIPRNLPVELETFWRTFRTVKLFEDREFGQWGLEILAPPVSDIESEEFQRQRSRDFRKGDRVLGRFLGDSELLLVRCDPAEPDFGETIIALPLDPRSDWETVGKTFADFVARYAEAEGNRFWE